MKKLQLAREEQIEQPQQQMVLVDDAVPLGPGQQEIEDNLLLLKITLYSEDNKATIINALHITRPRRMQMANDADIDLLTHFPFFFTHPQMV